MVDIFLRSLASSAPSMASTELSVESCLFQHALRTGEISCDSQFGYWYSDRLTSVTPQYNFTLNVPNHHPRDFSTYYTDFRTYLDITLSVRIDSQRTDVTSSSNGQATILEDTVDPEAELWDTKPYRSRVQTIHARVPIKVGNAWVSDPAKPSAIHYVTPGAQSPLILAHPSPALSSIVFPISQPVTTPESLEDTSARLLKSLNQSFTIRSHQRNSGSYAAVLWKKKLMAEEKGLLKPSAPDDHNAAQQKTFSTGHLQF